MKMKLLSLALAAASVAGMAAIPLISSTNAWAAITAPAVPDPAAQLEETARFFRNDDLAGLAQSLVPPEQWEQAKLAYELHKLKEIDQDDREHFAEAVARFTGPDAVDTLMAEIEPKLDEARPQAPGALMMAFGAASVAVNSPESDLTDDQRAALTSALPGVQKWATSTDFLDPVALRQALTLVIDAARNTGIHDIDQFKTMTLEQVLDRAAPVFTAAKQAVRGYGLDLDAIADSMQVDVLENDGKNARVRVTVMVFDNPVWAEHELELLEGRWYSRHTLHHIQVAGL